MLLPKKVGSFTLMRKLDADGLAESFVAILDDPPGKQVIARRILPVVARDAGRVAQLRARVGDLRAARHPSLVPVLDLVEADGDLYVLEEWSDAVDVGAVLQHCLANRVSVPHNVYLNLATQVCNALEALHGRPGTESGSENVLHLALCPQAMWVAVDGRVTVGRYGLARSPTSLATAATGALPPGVEYLAPEQTHQDQKLTPASDIFALGAILYELLTLKPMFRADSSLQTVHRVRRAEVTTQLLEVKEIMPGLDKVLFRALSLNPRHRYQRAFVLREDLRGLMAGYSFNDIDAVTRSFLTPIARARAEGGPEDTNASLFQDGPGGDTTGFVLGRNQTFLEPIGDPDSDYTDALLREDSDALELPADFKSKKGKAAEPAAPPRGAAQPAFKTGTPARRGAVEERDTDRGSGYDPEDADTAQSVGDIIGVDVDDRADGPDTDIRPSANTAWVRQPGSASGKAEPARRTIEPVDTGYSRRPTAQPLATSWARDDGFQGLDDAETTGAHETTTNLLEPTTGPIDDLLLDPPSLGSPLGEVTVSPAPGPLGTRAPASKSFSAAPNPLTTSSSATAPHDVRGHGGRDTIPLRGGDPATLDIESDSIHDAHTAAPGTSASFAQPLPDTAEYARRGSPPASAPPAPQTAQNADRDRNDRLRRHATASWADSAHTQPNVAPGSENTLGTVRPDSPRSGPGLQTSGFVQTRRPVEPQTLDLDPNTGEAPSVTANTADSWAEIPTQTKSAAAASMGPPSGFVAPAPVPNPVGFDELSTASRPYPSSPPPAQSRAPVGRGSGTAPSGTVPSGTVPSGTPIPRRTVSSAPPQPTVESEGGGGGGAFLTVASLVLVGAVAVAVCTGLGAAGVVSVVAARNAGQTTTTVAMADPIADPAAPVDVAGVPPRDPGVTGAGSPVPVPAQAPAPVAVQPVQPSPVQPNPVQPSRPAPAERVAMADPAPDRRSDVRDPFPEPRPAPAPAPARPAPARPAPAPRVAPEPPPRPMPVQAPSETWDAVAELDPPASASTDASIPSSEYERWSSSAFEGQLSPAAKGQLAGVPASDPGYTRARTLLYLDAKARKASAERDGHLLAMMSLPENKYNPVLLVETAQTAVGREDWLTALKDAQTAEQHWARLPSDLVFSRKAMIYEIQAVAQTGLFYASDGENKDRLFQAIRNWERYRNHAQTKGRTDLVSRAEEHLEHLNEIQRRLE